MYDSNRIRSREDHVYLAKLADRAERYQDMVNHMKKITSRGVELNVEERNLLSNSFRNLIGSRRTSWRIVSALYRRDEKRGNREDAEMAKEYRQKIEKELENICLDVIALVDRDLIPFSKNGQARVSYHKMKGDYYRYLAEFYDTNDRQKKNTTLALQSYREASDIARAELDSVDPTRMSLALNYSVFQYEMLNKADEATIIAKQALEDALPELSKLTGENQKDATLLIQLLRDNLSLWAERPDSTGLLDDDDEYYY